MSYWANDLPALSHEPLICKVVVRMRGDNAEEELGTGTDTWRVLKTMWNIINVIIAKIGWRRFGTLAFKPRAATDSSYYLT